MAEVKKAVIEKGYGDVVVVDNVKSHANDPFFVKKVEDAKKALSKITLPGKKSK
ncbi:MAG TPA: hypothetical protein VFE53_06665 [Mucilaginibacter sp.]|jgi:hypothetical protein|nr:hypothetical protein [Mucilaginibacter sp.]